MGVDLLSQAEDRCDAAGHVWSTADDPDCCPDCLREALLAARAEGHRAGIETAARLADELAERYRGDRFAPLDYREGWRDALSACARDLRGLEAQP